MVGLYSDPNGESIFSEVSKTTELGTTVKVADNEVLGLQRQIKELEDEVNEKNVSTLLRHNNACTVDVINV